MPKGLYLTAEEVTDLGVDLDKLNGIRRELVLDEIRVFVTIGTLRTIETVAEDSGMVFATQQRYGKLHKAGMLELAPGTVLGPNHIHGNFMVGNEK